MTANLGRRTVAGGEVQGSEYRPHLDGLRAIAVYLVVAYHAGVDRLDGGFIGVDVFFVLSGYLVTQILLRDLAARGRIRLSRFYARRFRRLLPASFVALFITAIVYSAIASQAQVDAAENAFKAAFLYVANWFFIHRAADYFAADINTNPVIHYWSLAVEEQFYLLWPLLFGGLFLATRRLARRTRALQAAVGAAGLVSLVWALHLQGVDPTRAYYSTGARAYELLAGALLALTPGVIRRAKRIRLMPVGSAVAVVALVVVSSSVVHLEAISRGVAATVVTVVLLIAIESSSATSPVNRVLSCRPATYLGRISYGTYLWHWPVIIFALLLLDHTMSPMSLFAVSVIVATGLASLSYTLLEMPIRQPQVLDRVPRLVIAAGLAIAMVSALVLIPSISSPPASAKVTAVPNKGAAAGTTTVGSLSTAALDIANAKQMPKDLAGVRWAPDWNCYQKPASQCTVIDGTRGHVLVIGDSTAWAMFPAFAKLAQTHHLTLSTAAAKVCPWQRHLFYANVFTSYVLESRRYCIDYKRDLYERVIPQLKPDLVVAIGLDYLDALDAGGPRAGVLFDDNNQKVDFGSDAQFQAAVTTDTRRSVAEIARSAGKVLLVDPAPSAPWNHDPYDCLTKKPRVAPCRFVIDQTRTAMDKVYSEVANGRRIFNADIEKLYCPYAPICDPVINGKIVWSDVRHVTPRFAETLAPPIAAYLRDTGLIR